MQDMCDNMMKSMLDNPDTMNEITAQLAKTNKKAVSYTPLDVYKRQAIKSLSQAIGWRII